MKKRTESREFKKTSLRQQAILNNPDKFLDIPKTLKDELQLKVRAYSQGVTELDAKAREYEAMAASLDVKEAEANDIGARILASAASVYGRSSEQIKLLGGVRLDDRKKPGRPPKEAPAAKEALDAPEAGVVADAPLSA